MKHSFLTGLALMSVLVMSPALPAVADQSCGCQGDTKDSCTCKNRPAQNCGCDKEAKELYRCPMHPEVTSDKPGQTCPKCEMPLEKAADSNAKPDAGKPEQAPSEHKDHNH